MRHGDTRGRVLCEAGLEGAEETDWAWERRSGQECELWVWRDLYGEPHLWALATLECRLFSVAMSAGWALGSGLLYCCPAVTLDTSPL